MRNKTTWCATLAVVCLAGPVLAENLAQRLLAAYDVVRTVRCEVRREIGEGDQQVQMLSRVYFERPDKIHVDNFTPLKRRHVCDGQRMFYHVAGEPKGYSRPVAELDDKWLASLRKVPGTAMDLLWLVEKSPEKELPATDEFPVRKGYESERQFAVFSLDAEGRLARIEFYDSPAMEKLTMQCDYSDFEQVADGVWIPRLHQAMFEIEGLRRRETTRVMNLVVNQPIDQRLFSPEGFFEGVEFTDSFEQIYE